MNMLRLLAFLTGLLVANVAYAQCSVVPCITGGSFTAGGTSNQIQYYGPGGQFAGFTPSGDCTITVSTGVIACSALSGNAANGILQANGAGVISAITIGSGLSFSGGTLSSTGGGSGCTVSGTANQMISNNGSTGCQSSSATLTTTGAIGSLLDMDFSGTTAACTASTNGIHITATNVMSFCINGSSIGSVSTTSVTGNNLSFTQGVNRSGTILWSGTAPSAINASCGSTSAFANTNGTASFEITIGGTGITSTCSWTMPAASHHHHCWGDDITTLTEVVHQTAAASTTSVAITFYAITTGLATAPTSGDTILVSCVAD